jgi:site-specific DNA-methyltransferase (adenine-specific)
MEAGRYDLSRSANQAFEQWCGSWAREALRVLKPGGHLVAFGGARTAHRLACGIEDAGFELRDSIMWVFAQGFPKNLNVGRAIDSRLGAEREVIGVNPNGGRRGESKFGQVVTDGSEVAITAPATPEAEEWDGWGTALEPAHEPIIVGRKPLIGTVAENVLSLRTGAINVDGCRIGTTKNVPSSPSRTGGVAYSGNQDGSLQRADGSSSGFDPGVGRWPANLALSHAEGCVPAGTREVKNEAGSVKDAGPRSNAVFNPHRQPRGDWQAYGENGVEVVEAWACVPECPVRMLESQAAGSSRFFFCGKTSRIERNAGLDGFEEHEILWSSGEESPGTFQSDGTDRKQRNFHPTVKPIDLMRWLVRLVCPPGGTVLDLFAGSGTTGCACALEGMEFVGIERDRDADGSPLGYIRIAEARIKFWASKPVGIDTKAVLRAELNRPERRGQLSIL